MLVLALPGSSVTLLIRYRNYIHKILPESLLSEMETL